MPEMFPVTPRKICSASRATKERIAGYEQTVSEEADAAGRVARCMDNAEAQSAYADGISFMNEKIGSGEILLIIAPGDTEPFGFIVGRHVIGMHDHGGVILLLQLPRTTDMVIVCVGKYNVCRFQAVRVDIVANPLWLVSRIYDTGIAGKGIGDNNTVRIKLSHNKGCDLHYSIIREGR